MLNHLNTLFPIRYTAMVLCVLGLLLVHSTLRGVGLRERIKIGCAGKVVTAFDVALLMALGADWCNSAAASCLHWAAFRPSMATPARAPRGYRRMTPCASNCG
jgi:hypothetical protein